MEEDQDEPVPDDHVEGEDEEPKGGYNSCWWWALKLPQGKEMCQNDQSGQVPEDLQQLYEEGSKHSPP